MERSGIKFVSNTYGQPPSAVHYVFTTLGTSGLGKLQFIEPPVCAQLLDQFIVRAHVADGTVFENHDAVGPPNRRQPMRNHKYSTPRHQILQCRLHQRFGFAIERGSRLVENQDGSIFQDCPRNGNALALTAGQAHSAFADHGAVAFRKRGNKFVRVRRAGRVLHLFFRDMGLAISNIVAQRVIEEHRFLRNDANLRTQRSERHIADIVDRQSESGRQ